MWAIIIHTLSVAYESGKNVPLNAQNGFGFVASMLGVQVLI